jgi:hypothetical protein
MAGYTVKTIVLFVLMIWGGWLLRTDRHGHRK